MRSLLFLAGTALALLMGSHSLLAQPVITTLTPTANAVSSPRSQALSATFSQPLQAASTSALKVFSARRGGLRTGHSGTRQTFNLVVHVHIQRHRSCLHFVSEDAPTVRANLESDHEKLARPYRN